MAFEFLGYQFDGAYKSADSLEARSGVYIIWSACEENWHVIDVGESDNVRERIKNHERKDCWVENSSCDIYYSATYTSNLTKEGRFQIEQKIRKLKNPPCGNR